MRTARRDKARIAVHWNALVRGTRPLHDELDRDLTQAIAALHARDDAPSPAPGFAHRLEEQLMNAESTAFAAKHGTEDGAPRGQSRAPAPVGMLRAGLPAFALLALALALVTIIGLLRLRDERPDGNSVPAAAVSTPSTVAAATPAVAANAAPAIPGCTTEPRQPGRVEQLFADAPPPIDVFGVFPTNGAYVLDGDFYLEHFTTGPAAQSEIDAINATLEQLYACFPYFESSNARNGRWDTDGRYFANFSDDYFTRQAERLRGGSVASGAWMAWIPPLGVTPIVERAWKMIDGRVMTTVLAKNEPDPKARTTMIFAETGNRWLIDEIATAVIFDQLPNIAPTPISDGPVQTLPIVIYDFDADAVQSLGMDGNYSFLGQYAPDYPFLADGGVTIHLVNLGSLSHRFTIPDLGIDQTLAPGGVIDIPIDAPVGSYQWEIYENGGSAPTATHTLVLVAPGTKRGQG